jgi:hypothetical protein
MDNDHDSSISVKMPMSNHDHPGKIKDSRSMQQDGLK